MPDSTVGKAGNGADSLIIHYMTMRKMIGWLGLLYPFIMVLGSVLLGERFMRMSISQYYHSPMGDVFVGILFAQAMVLYAYRGYKYDPDNPGHNFFIKLSDNTAGNIAAVAAVGTAIFPTIECSQSGGCGSNFSSYMHWFFSASFFLILSYFCLCLFVQTNEGTPKGRKKQRNTIYRICGRLMLLAMALALIKALLPADLEAIVDQYNPIFWLETMATVSFGLSWLVKGEFILKDIAGGSA